MVPLSLSFQSTFKVVYSSLQGLWWPFADFGQILDRFCSWDVSAVLGMVDILRHWN
jgi:hypothetical protein